MPFVGRSREIGALSAELAAVRSGAPRVVLVEGVAGIGKTTLVERLLAGAGMRILRASGDEFETGVALGVADQLLRQAGERISGGDHVRAGAQLLDVLGELQPAIVLVDDAQWADAESLRALLFAHRRLVDDAVLVLLVVRAGEAAQLPDGLRKPARAIALEPLAVDEVRALADGLGVAISPGAARRLHEHSGGSPLHARALLSELPPDAWETAGELPAPRSYAEMVAARVGALAPDSVALLEGLAVLGLQAPLAAAARVGDVELPFDALDGPVAARLVQVSDGPDIAFAHPLIRAAIRQGLPPGRRARLHAAAAAAAEDEAAVLRHRVAASAGDDEPLARELEAFAARCSAERRWAAAVWALQAAARLSATSADRERRVLEAVEAAMYGGDGPRARALAATTGGFQPSPRLDTALAYVALGAGRGDEAEERLRRAWAGGDAARIAERIAFLAILRLRSGDAIEWARRALALIAEDDPARGPSTWWLALGLYWSGERAQAREVVAEEQQRFGRSTGSHGGGLLLADDEPAAARPLLATAAAEAGSLVVRARALAKASQAAFVMGDWDEAVVLAEQALVIAAESDEIAAQAPAYWAAASVAAARGDEAPPAPLAVFEGHLVEVRIGQAELAAARGAHEQVLDALVPLTALAADDPGHFPWAHLYADALVGLGRSEDADRALTEHERIAELRGARLMAARLARVRAAWHLAGGDYEAAEAAFLPAPAGMPYERAAIEFVHGRALRRGGQRRRAAELLGRSRATLAALGAVPLLARCDRELAACGLVPSKRGDGVDRTRLTPQERSVARLAASGLGNREIAAELLLSVKTVERHLTHVYRKLGVSSRAELDP